MKIVAGTIVWVVPLCVCVRAPALAKDECKGDNRALAWATVMRIRDESVHSMESRDRVTSYLEDGTAFPFQAYEVRWDDLRNLRYVGEQCLRIDPSDPAKKHCEPTEVCNIDGRLLATNVARDLVIARSEKPDLLIPWCVGGAQKGLGHLPNIAELPSRWERFFAMSDLHVVSERPDATVVLGGTELHLQRPFATYVELDTSTGCVTRHWIVDLTFNTNWVEWRMPTWIEMESVFVPTRTEFRVFQPVLSAELRDALKAARDQAGLGADATFSSHPRFAEWVNVRDRVMGGTSPEVRIATEWKRCDIEPMRVNPIVDRSWFEVPKQSAHSLLMNDMLECQVQWGTFEPAPPVGNEVGASPNAHAPDRKGKEP